MAEASPLAPPLQPTADETRNGWTPQALAKYVTERNLAAGKTILDRKPAPVMRANSKYSVFRWRDRA